MLCQKLCSVAKHMSSFGDLPWQTWQPFRFRDACRLLLLESANGQRNRVVPVSALRLQNNHGTHWQVDSCARSLLRFCRLFTDLEERSSRRSAQRWVDIGYNISSDMFHTSWFSYCEVSELQLAVIWLSLTWPNVLLCDRHGSVTVLMRSVLGLSAYTANNCACILCCL
jgi:hypothetical protein